MKLGQRLLVFYFLILGLVGWFVLDLVFGQAKPLVRQSAEETLVDAANLLAEIVAEDAANGQIVITPSLRQALNRYAGRTPDADIWGLKKDRIHTHIYITGPTGVVLFDSRGKDEGEDFSRWNDVHLTLQGRYGARTTRTDPEDPSTSVMYVAAPIRDGGSLVGVISLGKPGRAIEPFVQQAERHLMLYGGLALFGCLVLGVLLAWWLSRRVNRLRRYAEAVANNERPAPPVFRGNDEIRDLADAVTAMRRRLEERARLEDNVSLLTHEMKSPLAAIRGAGEILHDEISDPSLTRFTDNVIHESQRLSDLLDRLLAMAKLEKLESLPARKSRVTISALVEDWQSSRYSLLAEKHLEVSVNDGVLQAEAETLKLALFNLLDNALRFANAETTLTVQVEGDSLTVENIGPAIPDYALDRVTERFYSLPAPGHDKSSGLGLTMVAEIASLHGGSLILTNTNNGVRATLTIPQN
ncbi:MAG: two-component system sensor histidine kinase CreC [Polaribacter sp.]|jgi:two-component system sensor histidine kinase CreC|uniref:two-component system sensor histidine kinase CreC n=3 Tax=Alcanivoracaceae TaxID=224372 RepID=UPI0023568242|nr:two-component system sensor histidine kinase CreC [Alcanivorax jadensis]MDF1635911.1 two-component system sensor histidine kinase CreC [Alcanivorax jadensis]|tara:strand:- start:372 stop:1781 length:1410 start_codon:yes stop_codon:yes gene_type:complete